MAGLEPNLTPDVAAAMPGMAAMPAPAAPVIQRDPPQPSEQRSAYINRWFGKIKSAKKHWEKDFKRMRDDMEFVFNGGDKEWCENDRYIANIVQQYVRQRVAALYARNPKFTCKRRERMDFMLWDGKMESMQMAQQTIQNAQNPQPAITVDQNNPGMVGIEPPPPVDEAQLLQATMLMQDIEQGAARRRQLDLVCKTMELLFEDCIKEQAPNFKKSMKQLIRRVETTGVGWVKIDYQRLMEPRPDEETQINDITHRLAHIDRLAADKADGKIDANSADLEELDQADAQIRREPDIITREGLIYSYPKSTAVIPDPRVRSLESLQGADWCVEEFLMTCDEIKAIYKKDIGKSFRSYTDKGQENNQGELFTSRGPDGYSAPTFALVWEVYDKKSGLYFVICDGYNDYLKEPQAPPVTLESFFPYIVLMFNEIEHDKQVYPLSDVYHLRHIQREYNRSKEALRQHRIASAPLYVTGAGQFDEEDQMNLALHAPHDVVVLKGLGEGEDVNKKLQQVKKHPIDPNVYETENTFQDMTRVVGTQEANLGSISGATATETSIADDSRVSSMSSNTDDLDEFLSEMARLGGQVLLMEMSVDEVKARVGQGAVWPELTRSDIMGEIFLTIQAGSSGRPNKAAKGAALERVQSIILSIPGVKPEWLFKQVMQTVDEAVDLTDAYLEGLPSITAMNSMPNPSQVGLTGPNNPQMQGGQGGMNRPSAPQSAGNAQPAYTAPGQGKNQFVN